MGEPYQSNKNMKKRNILVAACLLISSSAAIADELPYEIERIQNQRKAAIKKIDDIYVKELQKLKSKYLKESKLDRANIVDELIEEVKLTQDSTDPMRSIVGSWKAQQGTYTITNVEGDGYFTAKGQKTRHIFKASYDKASDKYIFKARSWTDYIQLTSARLGKGLSEQIGEYKITKTK